MSITRLIWISATSCEFVSSNGERVLAEAGYYSAELNVVAASPAVARRIIERIPPEQWTEATENDRDNLVRFKAKGLVDLFVILYCHDRNVYRYWSVLSAQILLKINGILARPAPYGLLRRASAVCRTEIDPRPWLELAADDHTIFRPQPDHDRFLLELGERPTGLAAKLTTFNSATVGGSTGKGATAVEFDIPIEKLLWRRAPKLLPDDIIPEGEDFVHFERMGHISDPGAPKELLPCPIRIIE